MIKRRFEIDTYLGIGPIILGMTRNEVHAAMFGAPTPFMRSPEAKYETDAYDDSGLHIYYGGDDERAVFIEAFHCSNVKFIYNGLSIFDTPTEKLIEHVANDGVCTVEEPRLHYIFDGLDMSLWRSYAPQPDEDDDEGVFESLGIGDLGYFSKEIASGRR